MTPSIKLIGAVTSILLLGGGFYVFDWSQRYQRKQAASQALREREHHWQQLQASIREFPGLQQEVRHKQSLLDQAMASSGAPEAEDDLVANYLVEVEQRAARGLSIRSVTPATGAEHTRVLNLSMQGSYGDLVDFLYELSTRRLDRLVTINSLRLGKGQGRSLLIEMPITAHLR
ncbi:hypothetical protein JST97_03325 [bacterium]|nr:hypothetical protein [bacterium]